MTLSWSVFKKVLSKQLKGDLPENLPPPKIASLSTDSRIIKQDDWFLPLSGENFDGHNFVETALLAGASGFFYEIDKAPNLSPDLLRRGIPVENVLISFQTLTKWWRLLQEDLIVFAITGSVGKTTAKEMLYTILSGFAPTLKTEGNYNNEIGVPKTLQRIEAHHKYAILELGARHDGDIEFLTKIVNPNVSCCLNVGTAHIEIFKTQEAILRTKTGIFKKNEIAPVCICFHDDSRILELCKEISEKNFITFGKHVDANVRLMNEDVDTTGQQTLIFKSNTEAKEHKVTFATGHVAYSMNAAAALAMGLQAGLKMSDMATQLSTFRSLEGRFKKVKKNGITFIDDCYNANPESMKAGIHSIAKLFPKDHKVLILGDMLELGNTSTAEHKLLGSLCCEMISPLHLITIGNSSQHISQQAIADGLSLGQTDHFANVEDFIAARIKLGSKGTIVYIKGSNGIGLNKILEQYR